MGKKVNENARERLRGLADSLEKNKYVWPVRALRAYLNEEVSTLDEAFGVAAAPGLTPHWSTFEQDCKIIELRRKRLKWPEVVRELGLTSEREPRRLVAALNRKYVPQTKKQLALQKRAVAAASMIIARELSSE